MSEPVSKAVAVLRQGGLVAFPTETVYGLGADASNPQAVARIFSAKERPADHPLIVHLGKAELLDEWAASVPPQARKLATACWPGALTLVLPRSRLVPDAVSGGLPTVGLRVPNQPLALQMLRAFGGGVAAPSANKFGRPSPTTADDVRTELGDAVDYILDGGPCEVGVESTILDLTEQPPCILRPGGVSADTLEAVLGQAVQRQASGPARAPGMLEVHYAPNASVRLVSEDEVAERARQLADAGVRAGVLASSEVPRLPSSTVVLSPAGDAAAFAHCLYSRLREADRRGVEVLLVVPPPSEGIGIAVIDRLRRAAARG